MYEQYQVFWTDEHGAKRSAATDKPDSKFIDSQVTAGREVTVTRLDEETGGYEKVFHSRGAPKRYPWD